LYNFVNSSFGDGEKENPQRARPAPDRMTERQAATRIEPREMRQQRQREQSARERRDCAAVEPVMGQR
jgi:hypothetical protein